MADSTRGAIMYVSTRLSEMVEEEAGFSVNLVGLDFFNDFLHPKDKEAVEKVYKDGGSYAGIVSLHPITVKENVSVRLILTPLMDGSAVVQGFVVVVASA